MSDDLGPYRELDLDITPTGRGSSRRERDAADSSAANAAAAEARFFVRPGVTPPPANGRADVEARPIQPPRRPAAGAPVPDGPPAAPARAPRLRTLRLLAFNTELRPTLALNGGLVQGNPLADARFDALVEGLKAQDADIVVLQELYDLERIERLRHVFRNRYPNVAFKAPGPEARLGCGHVILSNRPFADMRFEPIKGGPEPDGMVEKGMLVTRVALSGGAIRLAALQGCAFGVPDWATREDTPAKRGKFARRIVRQLVAEDESEPLLVVGDLSSGPEYRPELFAQLDRAGFTDAVAQADDTMRVTGRAGTAPPPRPDRRPQVFARMPEWPGVYFSAWRALFDDSLVADADGIGVPLAQRPALELLMDLEPH